MRSDTLSLQFNFFAERPFSGIVNDIEYDDFEFSARVDVPLTTVIHPNYQIGKWAAEILFDEIQNQKGTPPRHTILKPTIAERRSVKLLTPNSSSGNSNQPDLSGCSVTKCRQVGDSTASWKKPTMSKS